MTITTGEMTHDPNHTRCGEQPKLAEDKREMAEEGEIYATMIEFQCFANEMMQKLSGKITDYLDALDNSRLRSTAKSLASQRAVS